MADREETITMDMGLVENYAAIGATNAEIADMLGVEEADVLEQYGDVVRRARAVRHIRLRNKQYNIALGGNVTMLTWLGKHELQQSDKHEGGAEPVKQYVGVEVEKV